MHSPLKRRPHWLKVPMPSGENFRDVRLLLKQQRLNTVCQSAHCPNIGDCWSRRTATFMILGNVCTRNCRFCAIESAAPDPPDAAEPERVALAAEALGLRYVVITSVTRDDLPDGGASQFAETIRLIKRKLPNCQVEVLIPDFQGDAAALESVMHAQPNVLNHNIETVERLYRLARPQADYARSLEVLRRAKAFNAMTKSGIMLGLDESLDEIRGAMQDLRAVHCDILTIGQYLQPSKAHLPVQRFVTPPEFDHLKIEALAMGFKLVESGPLVRSSYHADQASTLN
ncbi:lipoyl synthase [candidate division KSB1 bacterium]|nr:lipoyl synthase [candidate division KSB1 bacterium]